MKEGDRMNVQSWMNGRKEFGFGPEVMKKSKVCRLCGCTCSRNQRYCEECGAVLPRETLFDLYKSRHMYCPVCDTVVSDRAVFCPKCGTGLRNETATKITERG